MREIASWSAKISQEQHPNRNASEIKGLINGIVAVE
jgi:hypothetical protein